jgi:hypothetical protein
MRRLRATITVEYTDYFEGADHIGWRGVIDDACTKYELEIHDVSVSISVEAERTRLISETEGR